MVTPDRAILSGTNIQTMTAPAATVHEYRRLGGLRALAWPALDRYPVDALVTTRHGGVSAGVYATLNLSFGVGDRQEDVLENRRRAAGALGADLGDFALCSQVHGAVARVVGRADRGRGAAVADAGVGEADALVTKDPGTVVGVMVADCVPILLYDPGAHVVACVHAGWRGTVAGVTGAALDAMAALGTRPGDVIAGIGPAIGPDRYQVGEDVAAAVRECLGERAPLALRPDGTGRWLCDLWSANRVLLREAGVAEHNIHVAAVPTGADFFSNRSARPCGRFGLFARLRPRDGEAR
jgi:YfiH family protein